MSNILHDKTTTNANGLPVVDRPCPPWCAEHIPDTDQCVSPALDAGAGCATWLVQERDDAEPAVAIDTAPSGARLTIDQADELSDAIEALLRAVREGSPVQWTPAGQVEGVSATDQTMTDCPDWCTTNHVNDPDGGHDGPSWPAVQSIAGPDHRVLVSTAQHETGSMVVYLAAADLPLTPDQARAAGLALLSAASWAKDHAVPA